MYPRPPALLFSAYLLVLGLTGTLYAEPTDGFTVQERSGIVLVKPQAWSKDSQAVVVEFEAFTDRTARGSSGAGYIEFRTKNTPRRQIPTSRIVKMVTYPNADLVNEVITQQDRDALAATVKNIETTAQRFPASRTYILPAAEKIQAEVTQYDAGNVKTDGKWIPKSTYVTTLVRKYSGQLRPEILKADPPSSFKLESDTRYLALLDLARTSPSVKPLVEELTELHGNRVRGEKRKALLVVLASPSLDFQSASDAVAELKTLQPDEDPHAVLFLKNWEAGSAEVETAAAEAEPLVKSLETEMKAATDVETPPEISPELTEKIRSLNAKLANLMASKPPAALVSQAKEAVAVCAIASGFSKLRSDFDKHLFLQAKDTLDILSYQSQQVGPETKRVVGDLQRRAAAEIGDFSRLREEGKLQQDANKPAEALAAYEQAYAVIPDPAVGNTISELKAQLEKDTPEKK